MTSQKNTAIIDINGFIKQYPANADLYNNVLIWNALKACVLMPEQLNAIILANDYLAIPPAESFLRWCDNHFPWVNQTSLTTIEKRRIGLFWRYIFRDVLHYRKQVRQLSSVATLKTATRYELPA